MKTFQKILVVALAVTVCFTGMLVAQSNMPEQTVKTQTFRIYNELTENVVLVISGLAERPERRELPPGYMMPITIEGSVDVRLIIKLTATATFDGHLHTFSNEIFYSSSDELWQLKYPGQGYLEGWNWRIRIPKK